MAWSDDFMPIYNFIWLLNCC